MQTKDYAATHYSKLSQINTENVKHLKVAWRFSARCTDTKALLW